MVDYATVPPALLHDGFFYGFAKMIAEGPLRKLQRMRDDPQGFVNVFLEEAPPSEHARLAPHRQALVEAATRLSKLLNVDMAGWDDEKQRAFLNEFLTQLDAREKIGDM